MIKKYKGCLGEFQYDDTEFQLKNNYLRYIGTETDGSKIKIPAGITNCDRMFYGCNSLLKPPEIPTEVTNCCGMFYDCRSLVEAPAIPKGVTNCGGMFSGCKLLIKAPEIPEGVTNCYGMFWGCKSLIEAPTIPTGVTDCGWMFYNCNSLTKAPVIPTSVTNSSYMFCDCTSLQERPDVPDHLVGEQSYAMFHNCPDPTAETIEDDIKPEETNKTEQSDICSSCIHKDICANRKTYGEAIAQYIADFGCKYYKE